MASILTFALLALASSRPVHSLVCGERPPQPIAPAAPSINTTALLGPLINAQSLGGATPATNVSLFYGLGDVSLVNVSLAMRHPAVLLEEMAGVVKVDCTNESVMVTFADATSYGEAVAAWTDPLVFVTNHLGDCDAEFERGFFLADEFRVDAKTWTIDAIAERKDVATTALYSEIYFANLPARPESPGVPQRRDLSISESMTIPTDLTLFNYDGHLKVKTDSLSSSFHATISGHVKFAMHDGIKLKLKALHVDLDVSMSTDFAFEVDLIGKWNKDFTLKLPPLAYHFIQVPGILQIGPGLHFDVGIGMAVEGDTTITVDVGSVVDHGTVHLDLVDPTQSHAGDWAPTHKTAFNITEKVGVSVDPFFDVSAMMDFRLLGGLLDLGAGVRAQPRFHNEFAVVASQDMQVTAGGVAGVHDANACDNGVVLSTSFDFKVDALLTQFWTPNLYKYEVPLAKGCVGWL